MRSVKKREKVSQSGWYDIIEIQIRIIIASDSSVAYTDVTNCISEHKLQVVITRRKRRNFKINGTKEI